jgi:hypothetical protein
LPSLPSASTELRSVGQNDIDELPATRSISQRMDRDLARHARRHAHLDRPSWSGSPCLATDNMIKA